MAGVCLATQAYAIHLALAHWQTMVFTVLTLSQMGNVLAIRSERESLFRQGLFSNLPLLGAVLLTFGLQMADHLRARSQPDFSDRAADLAGTGGMRAAVGRRVRCDRNREIPRPTRAHLQGIGAPGRSC